MPSIRALHGKTASFVQPSIWKKRFHLKAGDDEFGVLAFPRIWSSQADVESSDGKWIIERKGILNPEISLRVPDAKRPLATMSLRAVRGILKVKLPNYRSLRLVVITPQSEYALKTNMNALICSLTLKVFPKFSCELTIKEQGESLIDYPWLPYLLAYMALTAQRNNAA